MKTLEDIKQGIAKGKGWDSWEDYENSISSNAYAVIDVDEVAIRFAKEVAREALRNAAENADCIPTDDYGRKIYCDVDKQSILNNKNIPEI